MTTDPISTHDSNRSRTVTSARMREAHEFVKAEMAADPHYQRLAAAGKLEEPDDVLFAQFGVVIDKFVAQCIRNDLAGKGKGLRANGLTDTAALIEELREATR